MSPVELIRPSLAALRGFADACRRGWSRDNVGGAKTARADLEKIAADPQGFVDSLTDPDAKGGPITLPDGRQVARLPGYQRWIWDGEFCGSLGFRWQPGTSALPPHVLGHMGYSVVAWKQGRGYATEALRLVLPDARARGLDHVILTTEPENLASQRVIEKNGGVLIDRGPKPAGYGEGESLTYRIGL